MPHIFKLFAPFVPRPMSLTGDPLLKQIIHFLLALLLPLLLLLLQLLLVLLLVLMLVNCA